MLSSWSRLSCVVAFCLLTQSAMGLASMQRADYRSETKIYTDERGLVAPALLPVAPFTVDTGKCKRKSEGKTVLSMIVDASGNPRDVYFLDPAGTDVDKMALIIAGVDRFKPAMFDGSAVEAAQTVEIAMQLCYVKPAQDSGKKDEFLVHLRSQPQQHFFAASKMPEQHLVPAKSAVGHGATNPVVLRSAEPEYSDEARRDRIQGNCILSLVVNAQGMPEDIRVARKLGSGLDEKAVAAVKSYRFRPAFDRTTGEAVPKKISIEVRFKLY